MDDCSKIALSCDKDCQCHLVAKQFTNNVLTTLEQIKGETAWKIEIKNFSRLIYWDKHSNLLALLHKEVSKLSVMYTTPPLPKCADEKSLFDGITQCLLAMISSLYHLPQEQGQTLFKQWYKYNISLLSALHEFSVSLWNSQNVAQCTGAVWELCASGKNLPKDNKESLIVYQKQELALVDDAYTELEMAKNTYESGRTEAESMSNYDLSVLVAGFGLVKTAKLLITKSLKSIKNNGHADTVTQITDYDVFYQQLSSTSELVDDFAASLYPPSHKPEVKSSATSLTDHLSCFLETFRQSHFCIETDGTWTTVFENAVKHNHDKVSQLVT
ncbi:cyclin-D1-binding protein 1 homolog [Watersipora subatra]|uniref:cyclin-D1-binding protein 1 homolog n=1 Tax=Watersipora subatra TaxID=2589382 RepID=UPI00355BD2A1